MKWRGLPSLLSLFLLEFVGGEGDCGALCSSERCDEGCGRFRPFDTCHSACNFTSSQFAAASGAGRTLACLSGCRMAANRLAQSLDGLQSPRVVPESVTETAMNLLWRSGDGMDVRAGTVYLQSRRVRDADEPKTWATVQRIRAVDGGAARDQVLRVERLVPFEKYQFRVLWRLPEAEVHSPPSKIARTEADERGRPSRPILQSARQERGLRVSVTWRPPSEPRGPLAFYRLHVRDVSADLKDKSEVRLTLCRR